MSPVRKAMQCPRVGCSEWAMFAVEEDVRDDDILLWRCSAGHRGPTWWAWIRRSRWTARS